MERKKSPDSTVQKAIQQHVVEHAERDKALKMLRSSTTYCSTLLVHNATCQVLLKFVHWLQKKIFEGFLPYMGMAAISVK